MLEINSLEKLFLLYRFLIISRLETLHCSLIMVIALTGKITSMSFKRHSHNCDQNLMCDKVHSSIITGAVEFELPWRQDEGFSLGTMKCGDVRNGKPQINLIFFIVLFLFFTQEPETEIKGGNKQGDWGLIEPLW